MLIWTEVQCSRSGIPVKFKISFKKLQFNRQKLGKQVKLWIKKKKHWNKSNIECPETEFSKLENASKINYARFSEK